MSKGIKKLIYIAIFFIIILVLALPKLELNFAANDKVPVANAMAGKKLPVNGYIAKNQNLNNSIRITGTVIPNESVEIRSEISGKVDKIFFKEGQSVKKGQILLKINDDDLNANLSKLKHSKKLYEDSEFRQRKLLEREAISQEEYDFALNSLNTTIADIGVLEVQMSRTEIKAPFDGVIGLRSISEGSYLTPSNPIANLYNINPAKIEFSISEKYSNMINIGDKILFSVESTPDAYKGVVYAIEPQIDQATRTLKLRASAPNNQRKLLPGQFAKIEMILESIPNALLVPTEAIVPELNGHKLFLSKNGKATPVNVKIGIRTDKDVQVIEGLQVGDTVITTGLLQIRPGIDVHLNITQEFTDF
jgi:membrane fusion protein, multidrug efflux system